MSDAPTPPGPGWWLASDGNWYPPDQTPGWTQPTQAPPMPNVPPPYGSGAAAPYGYGYGYTPLQPSPSNNGFAIASLIASCSSIFVCGLGSILGVIFGHIALNQLKRTNENGRGMAVAGLVIGYLGILAMIALVVFLVAASDGDGEFQFEFDSLVRSWK